MPPWPGQGGIYICTLPAQFGLPARHLVAGTNEAEDLTWGGYGEEATGATSQTDGRVYTLDHTGDWYLGPDIDQALATLIAGTQPPRLTTA